MIKRVPKSNTSVKSWVKQSYQNFFAKGLLRTFSICRMMWISEGRLWCGALPRCACPRNPWFPESLLGLVSVLLPSLWEMLPSPYSSHVLEQGVRGRKGYIQIGQWTEVSWSRRLYHAVKNEPGSGIQEVQKKGTLGGETSLHKTLTQEPIGIVQRTWGLWTWGLVSCRFGKVGWIGLWWQVKCLVL